MSTISVGTALVIAASGFITVFLMLALLWGAIVVVSKLINKIGPSKAPAAAPTAAPVAVPAAPAAGAFGGDVALIDVDEKTAACVMAIVSHETGIPLSELIFKKIKAL